MIVIDACTVISWVLEDEDNVAADAFLEVAALHGALVPGNFSSEVTHALLRAERRGRIDATTADIALAEIFELPLVIEQPDPRTVLSLARTHNLTCYDAAYLALAVENHVPLATVDKSLQTAAIPITPAVKRT